MHGTVQLQLHIIAHHHACRCVVTWKKLLCITSCGYVSHFHVQHGHMCPHVAINSMYKAKIVTVSEVT